VSAEEDGCSSESDWTIQTILRVIVADGILFEDPKRSLEAGQGDDQLLLTGLALAERVF
jgi:hypothetical protein